MQPPFFYPGVQPYINTGAIGAVIAHEITHGFDDQGRMFAKNGKLLKGNGLMSNASSAKFSEAAECFVEQYNAFKVEDIGSVNGWIVSYC